MTPMWSLRSTSGRLCRPRSSRSPLRYASGDAPVAPDSVAARRVASGSGEKVAVDAGGRGGATWAGIRPAAGRGVGVGGRTTAIAVPRRCARAHEGAVKQEQCDLESTVCTSRAHTQVTYPSRVSRSLPRHAARGDAGAGSFAPRRRGPRASPPLEASGSQHHTSCGDVQTWALRRAVRGRGIAHE